MRLPTKTMLLQMMTHSPLTVERIKGYYPSTYCTRKAMTYIALLVREGKAKEYAKGMWTLSNKATIKHRELLLSLRGMLSTKNQELINQILKKI